MLTNEMSSASSKVRFSHVNAACPGGKAYSSVKRLRVQESRLSSTYGTFVSRLNAHTAW